MTTLYLRDLTAANPPTAGEKSTALPVDALGANNATGVEETRSLRTTKGAAQTSIAKASDASTAARDNYLGRFTSPALAAQTLSAETWTAALALAEGNAAANSFLNLSVYVWRPSTSAVVGFVYDSHTNLGVEWAAGEDGIVVTFAGSAVTAVADDVLVLEVWRHAVQAMGTAYTQTIYYEGATDVVDTTTTDAASYLSKPATINFAAPTEVTAPNAVYAGTGGLTITGPVVTVLAGNATYGATGSLTVNGPVVTVLAPTAAYAGAGGLTITGPVVEVLAPNAAYPASGKLVIEQTPPRMTRSVGEMDAYSVGTLDKMWAPAVILAGSSDLIVSTIAPNASYPATGGLVVGTPVITVFGANTSYPATGGLVVGTPVLTLFAPNTTYAGTGGLTVTGPILTLFAPNTAYPGTGGLTVTGPVVTVLAPSASYASVGSLTVTGPVVTVLAANSAYPGTGSLTVSTFVIGIVAPNTVYPGVGGVIFVGITVTSGGATATLASYPASSDLIVTGILVSTLYIKTAPLRPFITLPGAPSIGHTEEEAAPPIGSARTIAPPGMGSTRR